MNGKILYMKTLSQLLEESFDLENKLNEMALVSDSSDKLPKKTKIYIYGEGDEQGTKTPHFHVIINNGEYEFEVKIENAHDLEIWRTKKCKKKSLVNTWVENSDVKKAIQEWLDKPNNEFAPLTNYQTIIKLWNVSNPTNKIK